jgi:hypothetical protein
MDSTPSSQSTKARRKTRKLQPTVHEAGLTLSSLPRFHPAAYSSTSSSISTTPGSKDASPQPVTSSPRSSQQRQQQPLSDAQRQIFTFQREMLNAARGPSNRTAKPDGPKLLPLAGSPGPVTPLELEGDGYLDAGAASGNVDVDKLIRDEAKRRGEISPRRHVHFSSA